MEALCRICMEQAAKCTPLSSKIDDCSNRSFFDFLNKCTTLNACESDSLPQSLCSVCANAMKTFHSFMKLAEKSDLILREALRNLVAEGRYNGRRETPRGEIAITKKIEEASEDFSQGNSFHCQPSIDSTGRKLYSLDIVKKEPIESTQIVHVKNAGINEAENFHSKLDRPEGNIEELDDILVCIDRHLASIDAKHNDYEDDVPISLLKSRLVKNEDGADSQSNSQKVEEDSFHCQPSESGSSFYILDIVKEEPRLSESNEIDEGESNFIHPESSIDEPGYISPRRDSHRLAINHTEPFVTEADVPIDLLRSILYKNREEADSQSKVHQEIRHKCNQCDKKFRSIYNLRKHMRWHKNAKSFKCGGCGKSFRRKDRCITHNVICKRRSKPQQLKTPELKKSETDCRVCGKAFGSEDCLVDHMKNHLGVTTWFKCENCGQFFALEATYTKHLGICKVQPPPKTKPECNICGKQFSTKHYLGLHKENHKGIKKICVVCGKKFSSLSLRKHMRRHANPNLFNCETSGKSRSSYNSSDMEINRKFHCELCEKKFTTKYYLIAHMDSHKGFRKKCDLCGKEFQSRVSLKRHMKWHVNPKPYACEKCGKCFLWKCAYTEHLDTCKGPRQPKTIPECKICGKQFSTKHYLGLHMENHKGIKKKCLQCGKKFSILVLKKHMKKHANPKRFDCETCGKSFSNYNPRHMETCKHPGEPFLKAKFDCKLCDKKFTTKRYLSVHMESHKGLRHNCDQCGKDFKTSKSLRTHMERHTNPQSFKCEKCGEFLASKRSYTRHVGTCKGPRQPKATPECEICGKQFTRKHSLALHKETHKESRNKIKCDECGKELSSLSLSRHMKLHTYAKPFKCENCGEAFASKYEYIGSGHKQICKPIGNTIDDIIIKTEITEEPSNDIIAEVT